MNQKFNITEDPDENSGTIKQLLKGLDEDFLSDLQPDDIPDSEVSEVDASDLQNTQ